MVSVAFKYAGNILKSFAVGCSIALNCMLSWLLFGIVFSREAGAGILLVGLATVAYNLPRPLTEQISHELLPDRVAMRVTGGRRASAAAGEYAPLVERDASEQLKGDPGRAAV
eukprot:6145543-Prymnesium_polylepis.1